MHPRQSFSDVSKKHAIKGFVQGSKLALVESREA